jgi:hypothetical protein
VFGPESGGESGHVEGFFPGPFIARDACGRRYIPCQPAASGCASRVCPPARGAGRQVTERAELDPLVACCDDRRKIAPNANLVDLPFAAPSVKGLEPIEIANAVSQPAVELEEGESFRAEPFERQLDSLAQVPLEVAGHA